MERYDLMGTPYATQAEAIAGLIDDKAMTPLKTKQSIQENAPVKTVNGETGDIIVDSLPPGTIIAYAGDTVPDGFVDAGGAAVSRVTYKKIFEVFGTKYGAGDGSTTFNLPNLNNGSFLEGSNTVGTVKSAGLPDIQGYLRAYSGDKVAVFRERADGTGAFSLAGERSYTTHETGSPVDTYKAYTQAQFKASSYNSIYGNGNTVQPKSVTVKFCIKY